MFKCAAGRWAPVAPHSAPGPSPVASPHPTSAPPRPCAPGPQSGGSQGSVEAQSSAGSSWGALHPRPGPRFLLGGAGVLPDYPRDAPRRAGGPSPRADISRVVHVTALQSAQFYKCAAEMKGAGNSDWRERSEKLLTSSSYRQNGRRGRRGEDGGNKGRREDERGERGREGLSIPFAPQPLLGTP